MKKAIKDELRLQALILDYEVRASRAALLPFQWMRALAAMYLANKARRKYMRWIKSLEIQENLKQLQPKEPADEEAQSRQAPNP